MLDASFKHIEYSDPDDSRVFVVGVPYPAARHLSSYSDIPAPPAGRSILLAHCFATLDGGNYFGENILSYKDLYVLPYDVFIFGHDHSDHGVVALQAPGRPARHFVNIGALSRGSLSRENIERSPKCALVEATPSKSICSRVQT